MIKGIPLHSFEYLHYIVDSLGWMLPVYLYLFSFLYAFIHESGHALMAMCLGTRVTRFQVGKPVLFRFKRGRLILKFGLLFPDGGVSYHYANDAPSTFINSSPFASGCTSSDKLSYGRKA